MHDDDGDNNEKSVRKWKTFYFNLIEIDTQKICVNKSNEMRIFKKVYDCDKNIYKEIIQKECCKSCTV